MQNPCVCSKGQWPTCSGLQSAPERQREERMRQTFFKDHKTPATKSLSVPEKGKMAHLLSVPQEGLLRRENNKVQAVSSMRSNRGDSLKMCICRRERRLVRSCHVASGWKTTDRAGKPARPSHSLDLISCLKGDTRVFGKGMRQQADAEWKDRCWNWEREDLGEKASGWIWLRGLNDKIENSQSATGLEWGGRFVGYQHKESTCVCLRGWDYCCF